MKAATVYKEDPRDLQSFFLNKVLINTYYDELTRERAI